jgi:hypothetical protein
MKYLHSLIISGLAGLSLQANAASAPWEWLIGDWIGEGSGAPGQGSGVASFALDLQGHVLVRRNRSEYPASGSKPAAVHEDLLIVYPTESRLESKAVYFDNEDHVIEYSVIWSSDERSATFTSKAVAGGPLYRLVYRKENKDRMSVMFAIANSGRESDLKTYLSGTMRRK